MNLKHRTGQLRPGRREGVVRDPRIKVRFSREFGEFELDRKTPGAPGAQLQNHGPRAMEICVMGSLGV